MHSYYGSIQNVLELIKLQSSQALSITFSLNRKQCLSSSVPRIFYQRNKSFASDGLSFLHSRWYVVTLKNSPVFHVLIIIEERVYYQPHIKKSALCTTYFVHRLRILWILMARFPCSVRRHLPIGRWLRPPEDLMRLAGARHAQKWQLLHPESLGGGIISECWVKLGKENGCLLASYSGMELQVPEKFRCRRK